jgi:hypothetical protein
VASPPKVLLRHLRGLLHSASICYCNLDLCVVVKILEPEDDVPEEFSVLDCWGIGKTACGGVDRTPPLRMIGFAMQAVDLCL